MKNVAFAPRKSRPRRLEWEDDGVTVPWLSSGVAVYLLAVLNAPFWQRAAVLVAPLTLEGALFHAALFAGLGGMYACALCLVTARGFGRGLLVLVLLYASLCLYVLDNFGPALPDMLRGGATWREFARLPALWQIGAFGVMPALAVTRVPIGRRRGVREFARRLRFCLFCLLLAACAVGVQHRKLAVFFAQFPEGVVWLSPVNAIKFAGVRGAADVERLFVQHGDAGLSP
jgi:glucan phosphoethanolaminetransferase (alkaline phosphatase superfamily)